MLFRESAFIEVTALKDGLSDVVELNLDTSREPEALTVSSPAPLLGACPDTKRSVALDNSFLAVD